MYAPNLLKLLNREDLLLRFLSVISILLVSVLFTAAEAQIPTLTTDDIVSSSSPVPSKKEAEAPKSDANKKILALEEKSAKNPEEEAWNKKHSEIEDRLKKTNREADQIELEIVKVRNQLRSPNGHEAGEVNRLNDQVLQMNEKARSRRAEASQIQKELLAVTAEGEGKNFKILEPKLTKENGATDPEAVQQQRVSLDQELKDSQARIELKKLELNRLKADLNRSGNADRFAMNQIRQQQESAENEIKEQQKQLETLKQKISKLP